MQTARKQLRPRKKSGRTKTGRPRQNICPRFTLRRIYPRLGPTEASRTSSSIPRTPPPVHIALDDIQNQIVPKVAMCTLIDWPASALELSQTGNCSAFRQPNSRESLAPLRTALRYHPKSQIGLIGDDDGLEMCLDRRVEYE